MKKNNKKVNPASFRDPSGVVYSKNGKIFRQIHLRYKENHDMLMKSGLYSILTGENILIPHKEVITKSKSQQNIYKVIEPEVIPFISYPHEWCFGQLKMAALTTLKILTISLKHDMILKDASACNIQFIGTNPVFIDTLSLEKYREGEPWIAYRQFCRHFLAPLSLMAMVDLRLSRMLISHIDGIPLDLAGALLPKRSRINFGLLTHIHMNAKSKKYLATNSPKLKSYKLGKEAMRRVIDNLKSTVEKLELGKGKTIWSEYYKETNYSQKAFQHKQKIVENFLKNIRPKTTLDLGANTGIFSRIAAKESTYTLSIDNDPLAVEKNYRFSRNGHEKILPLVVDITNPSPGIGWRNRERTPFLKRVNADVVLSLALLHHLAIANNLPLPHIATLLKNLGRHQIIEFVPKQDSQTKRLLSQREDIFSDYTQEMFEKTFTKHFNIRGSQLIEDSSRRIYHLERHD